MKISNFKARSIIVGITDYTKDAASFNAAALCFAQSESIKNTGGECYTESVSSLIIDYSEEGGKSRGFKSFDFKNPSTALKRELKAGGHFYFHSINSKFINDFGTLCSIYPELSDRFDGPALQKIKESKSFTKSAALCREFSAKFIEYIQLKQEL